MFLKREKKLNFNEPILPRNRKIPKRIDSSSSVAHSFDTAKDYFRKQFYEILDNTVTALEERFDTDTINKLNKFEKFVIGKTHVDVTEITDFYNNTESTVDLDAKKLIQQRDIFIDTMKQKKKILIV